MSTLTRSASSPRVELIDRVEPFREDWIRLAAAGDNVFATWEWNELWWRHYGDGRDLRVGISHGDDGIDAIVPLFVWSQRPLRILRLIGHGHGDRLGPICRHGEVDTAERAFRHALEADQHDVFIGDWVAGDRRWAHVLGGRVVRKTGYPILRLADDSWEELLASQSQRFRKSLRNKRNRLDREHEVTYRYADSETLDRDLDTAFRLHRARFRTHSCFFCGDHEPFQREFATLAHERGWLRLLLLELDGEPACFEYGFMFQNAYFAYQGGWSPDWARHSVGFLAEIECMHRSFLEGATEYRFLGGEEGYKYRFPIEDPRLDTVSVPGSSRGRVAAGALAAALRLPGGKAVLRRIGS